MWFDVKIERVIAKKYRRRKILRRKGYEQNRLQVA